MKVTLCQRARRLQTSHGFTLVDAIFAMAVAGLMFVALYAGLGFGFRIIKMARENTRATQIMLEKMETIRLYTWTQINSNGFIPTNKFTVAYYAVGNTNNSLMYTGQVSIADAVVSDRAGGTASYSGDMKKVTIQLDWCPMGSTNRTRSMSTYVTRNGMQSYVYY
jgi:hypothetical protein